MTNSIFNIWAMRPFFLFLCTLIAFIDPALSTEQELEYEAKRNRTSNIGNDLTFSFIQLHRDIKANIITSLDYNSLVRFASVSKECIALTEKEISRREKGAECLPFDVQCPWLHTVFVRKSLFRFLKDYQTTQEWTCQMTSQLENFIRYCEVTHYIGHDLMKLFLLSDLHTAEKQKLREQFKNNLSRQVNAEDPIALELCLVLCAQKFYDPREVKSNTLPMVNFSFLWSDNGSQKFGHEKNFVKYVSALEEKGYVSLFNRLVCTFEPINITHIGQRYEEIGNVNKAVELYKTANKKGENRAEYLLINLCIKKNILEEAEPYLKPHADKGDQEAQCRLGILYVNANKLEKAEHYLEPLAQIGHPEAQCWLGILYANANKLEKAEPYLAPLAGNGHQEAQYWLSSLYAKTGKFQEAKHYLEPLAKKAHINAQILLGNLYAKTGKFQEAKHYLKRLADKGHQEAQYWLGKLYADGNNLEDAEPYLKALADKNDPEARYLLGKLYAKTRKFQEAKHYLKPLADAGIKDTKILLNNLDVEERKLEEAMDSLMLLAEKENKNA